MFDLQGGVAAANLYGWLGSANGGSTLGCQIVIEILMLLLYLYARVLARRAFGTSPTHEARALFMFLLLSDGARVQLTCSWWLNVNERILVRSLRGARLCQRRVHVSGVLRAPGS
eukprot:SAG11_NODE_8311_length_1031_cov_1.101931_2_plen_115_part_00